MVSIELAALRKRARAAGIAPGIVARAQRAKEAHQAEYRPSRQMGLTPHPARILADRSPVDFAGVQRWVVAVCKPSLALSVSQDLPALGFRAYCPLGRRIVFRDQHRSGVRKKHILQSAVFGRYLFVGEIDEPLQAYIHEGIVAVIGDSRGALGLKPEIVRAINDLELNGQWDDIGSAENPFKMGQSVRIVAGHPFEHFVGIVRALLPSGAKIDLDLFGRRTTVTVPVRKLVPAV